MTTLSAAHPFSFVLFGASGNLAKLKIYPALYTLALKGRLPAEYAIVGYARSEKDQAPFRAPVEESIKTEMIQMKKIKCPSKHGICFLEHLKVLFLFF